MHSLPPVSLCSLAWSAFYSFGGLLPWSRCKHLELSAIISCLYVSWSMFRMRAICFSSVIIAPSGLLFSTYNSPRKSSPIQNLSHIHHIHVSTLMTSFPSSFINALNTSQTSSLCCGRIQGLWWVWASFRWLLISSKSKKSMSCLVFCLMPSNSFRYCDGEGLLLHCHQIRTSLSWELEDGSERLSRSFCAVADITWCVSGELNIPIEFFYLP
jgi:hypothetical protein